MAELTYYDRIRIQMEYAVPLIKDLQAILGEDEVNKALAQRLQTREAEAQPEKVADFSRMAQGTEVFAAGGALQYEIIASDNDRFDMNVRQCRYAEMMDELGGRAFGHLLVCNKDFEAAKRLGMTLTRTQTRMQGADFCDFRYKRANGGDE